MASISRAVRNEKQRPLSPRNTIAHTEDVGVALRIEVRRGEPLCPMHARLAARRVNNDIDTIIQFRARNFVVGW